MRLDRFEQPVNVCEDPSCEWSGLADDEHFARHNRPCGQLTIGDDGSEVICELFAGHKGPHRGATRRPDPN